MDVLRMVEQWSTQGSESAPGKLAIVEMVEVYDAAHDTDLSVLHVIDEKMEPGLSVPLYKIMWTDYPDAFCNWEVRENMGRDMGKLEEYLRRKAEKGSGMLENPVCAANRPVEQVPELVREEGDAALVATGLVDEVPRNERGENDDDDDDDDDGEGGEKEEQQQQQKQQMQHEENGDEEEDEEKEDDDHEDGNDVYNGGGSRRRRGSLDSAVEQCQHCSESFKARGLLRHMATRHREEWLKLKQEAGKRPRRRSSSATRARRASMPAAPIQNSSKRVKAASSGRKKRAQAAKVPQQVEEQGEGDEEEEQEDRGRLRSMLQRHQHQQGDGDDDNDDDDDDDDDDEDGGEEPLPKRPFIQKRQNSENAAKFSYAELLVMVSNIKVA